MSSCYLFLSSFISNLLEGQIYFISSPSNFEKQLPILIVFNFKLNLIVIIMIEIFLKFYFQCQNNCDELGAADRVERERLEQLVQEGLRMKAELAAKGKFLF